MIIIALGNCPHPTDCSTPTSSHFPTPLYSINIFLSGGCLLIDRSAITIELNEANTQNGYILWRCLWVMTIKFVFWHGVELFKVLQL